MRRSLALFFSLILFVVFAIASGCGDPGDVDPKNVGSIIVGVTTDFRIGVDIDQLHVLMKVGDEVVTNKLLTTRDAASPLKLPAEFPFLDVDGGAVVSVQIDAFRVGDAKTPIVTRLASTKVVIGKTLLLRVHVDSRCAVAPGSSAPVCDAPETCIGGLCADSAVEPKVLPVYSPSWSTVTNDTCKPAGGGAPTVAVGEGQADYLPTMELDLAQVEAGPQGGHHIWVALRMKNLRQSGSITKVSGYFPDLDLHVSPFQVIFTFDPDEGGYCKLYGLRYQLDQDHDIQDLLGRVLEVTVQVTDKDGDVGVGKRTVTLSKDFI